MKNIFLILITWGSTVSAQTSTTENSFEGGFPKIKSSVTMPVQIPLEEVSAVINSTLPSLIYEDHSYTDNNNDQLKLKVWKTRPVRLIGGTDENLLIEVPLKIWIEKGIGTFGIYTYQNTTFETVMYFSSRLTLKNNWTVTTQTSSQGFKWVTKPVLDYGKIKVPITALVESSLKKQQVDFCKIIDGLMSKELNFQPYAILAWNQFSEPFPILEEYRTWLKITPLHVQMTPLIFHRNRLDLNIGIDVFSETFTGNKPLASQVVKAIPDFERVSQLPKSFKVQTTANIPFSEATALGQETLVGKEFELREGKAKVQITGFKVSGADGRILLEISTAGAVDGVTYISGIPVYSAEKRQIVLSETHLQLKTNNILYKTIAVLFKAKMIKTIETGYGIPTGELEDKSQNEIEETFNKEYYKGLKMRGKVYSVKPTKIAVTPFGLAALIESTAQLDLSVKGL